MAREVMDGIDLDPFSSSAANERIGATRFFDKRADALHQRWFNEPGTVFMNPPYGRRVVDEAVEAFLGYWVAGMIDQGIVLVNNATETRWFQALLNEARSVCLTNHRIAFETDDGKHLSGNSRGQAFLYFGEQENRFHDVFNAIGVVLAILHRAE